MLWSGFGVSAGPFLFLIFCQVASMCERFTATAVKVQDTFFDATLRDPGASLTLRGLKEVIEGLFHACWFLTTV